MSRGKRQSSTIARLNSPLPLQSAKPNLMLFPKDPTPGFDNMAIPGEILRLNAYNSEVLKKKLAGGLIFDLDDTLQTNHPLFSALSCSPH